MEVRDRDCIPDSITFFRLAEATNVPGEQDVSKAQLMLIHSNQRIQTNLEVQGDRGSRNRTQLASQPGLTNLTNLTSWARNTKEVVTFMAIDRGGEDNVLHTDRHSATSTHKLKEMHFGWWWHLES